MAERAGPPSTLVTPRMAVTAYTCHGSSLSNIARTVIRPMKMKLKGLSRGYELLAVPLVGERAAEEDGGKLDGSCTTPRRPS